MRVIARHKNWVAGATISESVSEDGWTRRFTATIDGWRGWHIWEGQPSVRKWSHVADLVIARVIVIRDRIRAGDESVFTDKEPWENSSK